jgi:hypothetical protein
MWIVTHWLAASLGAVVGFMAAAVLAAGREAPGARQERGNASDGQVIGEGSERAVTGIAGNAEAISREETRWTGQR